MAQVEAALTCVHVGVGNELAKLGVGLVFTHESTLLTNGATEVIEGSLEVHANQVNSTTVVEILRIVLKPRQNKIRVNIQFLENLASLFREKT